MECINMKTRKMVNLLNDTNSKSSKLEKRKLHVINDQNDIECNEGNENDSSIKFEAKVIKSSLCDYSQCIYSCNGRYNS